MAMSGRERIMGMLRGEAVDRVPFAINAWHWFYFHQFHRTLPPEYGDCQTPIEFLRRLGADILTRWDGQIKGRAGLGKHVRFPNCRLTREEIGQPIERPATTAFNEYRERDQTRLVIETPEGTLSQRWRFSPDLVTDFDEEYMVKDLDRDLPALRFLVADRAYDFVMDDFRRDLAAVGDAGIIVIEIPENPIKMLYWLMGPQEAMMALMTRGELFGELFERHTELALSFIDGVCARTTADEAPVLMSNDNLEAGMMPPYWFDQFLYAHYQRVSERVRYHGRIFAVHSCGKNWAIRQCVRRSGIQMLEGLTPPPVGDFPLELATRELGEDFIVNGGMSHPIQEAGADAAEVIAAYSRTFFAKMHDTPRLIYASSCQTSTRTPIENIHRLRDSCWKEGVRG